MSITNISKKLCRDNRKKKKDVENIIKLRIWSQWKGLKNFLPRDERKASYGEKKTFNQLLDHWNGLELRESRNTKGVENYVIQDLIKTSTRQHPLTKINILKGRNMAKKYIKN